RRRPAHPAMPPRASPARAVRPGRLLRRPSAKAKLSNDFAQSFCADKSEAPIESGLRRATIRRFQDGRNSVIDRFVGEAAEDAWRGSSFLNGSESRIWP